MEITKTNNVVFEAVYSADGMDYLMTRVLIDISAVLNPQAMAFTLVSGTPTETPGTPPATTVASIRHALLQPRRQLLITDAFGQVMLQCPADGYDVDARDGPRPIAADVFAVQGFTTFGIRWRCEAHIIECPEGADAPFLISNRWSDSSHINEYHLTTRVASGRVVFRKDFLVASGQVPDDFRHFFLPVVAPGFRRIRVDVTQNSAATEAMWQVTDQEMIYDLGESDARQGGSGILMIDGKQSIQSMPTPDGPTSGMTMNNLFLTAKGNRYSNQWNMIERLFELASTLLSIGNVNVGYIRSASISRSLGQDEKWVELQIAFWQNATANAVIGNLNLNSMRFDVNDVFASQPDGINPGIPNDNGTRGTSLATLVAQALTQSCEFPPSAVPPVGGPDDVPPGPSGPPPAINTYTRDILPEEPTSYNTDEPQYPYTSYKLEMKYETDMNILHAPVAGSPSGSTSDTPSTVVFRTAAPRTKLIISGMAERIGANPVLPNPVPTDSNLVLRRMDLNPDYPIVLDDGETPVTRWSIYYEYAMIEPPDMTNLSFRVGVLPWTTIPISDSGLTSDNFSEGIADI